VIPPPRSLNRVNLIRLAGTPHNLPALVPVSKIIPLIGFHGTSRFESLDICRRPDKLTRHAIAFNENPCVVPRFKLDSARANVV